MKLLFLLPLFLVAGCAHPSWVAYQGQQQNWPTSPGTFVDNTKAVPVFYGNPPDSYIMLGQLHLWSEVVDLVSAAAEESKKHGGDAVLIGPTTSYESGAVGFGSGTYGNGFAVGNGFAAPIIRHELVANAIKWKDPSTTTKFSHVTVIDTANRAPNYRH